MEEDPSPPTSSPPKRTHPSTSENGASSETDTAPPPPKTSRQNPEVSEDDEEEFESDNYVDVVGIYDSDPPTPPPPPLPRLPLACALEAARALDRMPDWRRKRRSKTPSTPSSPSSPARDDYISVRPAPPAAPDLAEQRAAPLVMPSFAEMGGIVPAAILFPRDARMPHFPRAPQRAELEYEREMVTSSSDDEDVPLNLGVPPVHAIPVVNREEEDDGEMGLHADEDTIAARSPSLNPIVDNRPSAPRIPTPPRMPRAPIPAYIRSANRMIQRDDPRNPPKPVVDNRPSAPPIPTPPQIPRDQIPAYLRQAPRMVPRDHPRNPLIEPPAMADYIQDNDGIVEPHPRAAQYPSNWTRAMVGYAEDRFWTERIVPLPPGLNVPPRPFDYLRQPSRSPTPEDFNWVPPPGDLPFQIPPEVWALREIRRQEHMRRQSQNQNQEGQGANGGNNGN